MRNLLIVDDNYYFATGLSMNLFVYLKDYNIVTARSGLMAMEIMQSTRVDCIVTDLEMPSMNGAELAEYVTNAYPSLPVFILTASDTPGKGTGPVSRGGFRCIEKGMGFKKLADFITLELSAFFRDSVKLPAAA